LLALADVPEHLHGALTNLTVYAQGGEITADLGSPRMRPKSTPGYQRNGCWPEAPPTLRYAPASRWEGQLREPPGAVTTPSCLRPAISTTDTP
jgi:hypothetical protein